MRVLIAAGGTAGHINPALAIAGALKAADPAAEIHFAGRKEGMEYGLVTKAGYPFHHIEINGFQRKPTLKNVGRNVVALYHLALSGPRTAAILKEVRPDLVIGCGGYVSGPVVRAAAKKGIKTAIHEQNAFPGVTNKLLAKDVDVVFAASAAAVEKLGAPEKTLVVGNPVRPEILNRDRAAARGDDTARPCGKLPQDSALLLPERLLAVRGQVRRRRHADTLRQQGITVGKGLAGPRRQQSAERAFAAARHPDEQDVLHSAPDVRQYDFNTVFRLSAREPLRGRSGLYNQHCKPAHRRHA